MGGKTSCNAVRELDTTEILGDGAGVVLGEMK